ncbi:GntR family transcriptional regulator [Ramlibacter sp. MAHUQ-53]|uniref:GntR family transcriptional regulator n=1 Tax=unclassified Ramlibacter TaxID=2617605 RepID=UPI00362C43E4
MPSLTPPPTTKHGLVSAALSNDIRSGRYKIGDHLPSEPELSLRFGVSRHTVRAALRTLHELGLVTSQQGVGTIVQETRLVSQYSHAFSSAQDLMQYATTTRVRILDREEVVIDKAQAQEFGCKPGEHWWRVRTVRSDPALGSAVAYSEIFIPLAFGAVLDETNRSKQPIFSLIEKRFGQTITEIRQEITCVPSVDDEVAAHLKVTPGAPAMQITRFYLGEGQRVLEVARSLHPSGVFKYAMRVQLRHKA